jgi:hypothetical protein
LEIQGVDPRRAADGNPILVPSNGLRPTLLSQSRPHTNPVGGGTTGFASLAQLSILPTNDCVDRVNLDPGLIIVRDGLSTEILHRFYDW